MHISENLKDESIENRSANNAQGTNRLWATVNALEQTQLAVVISDTASIIQYVNSGYTRMTGYTPDEVIGQNISKFRKHPVEDQKDVHHRLASGETWRDEFPILRKDGTTIWIYNVVSPILDEDGAITNYVGIGEDVSAIIQVDEGLRRREDRYRRLVEKAQDVVYTTDGQGHFDYVNPRAFELTGYTQEEMIGQQFTMLIHTDWRERVEFFYQEQSRNRTPETLYEFPIVTKTGHIKWVEQTVVLATHDGEITGFQAIVRDITRRKQAEAEAKALVRENAVLAEITRIISSSLDIGEVYEAFATEVNKLLNFDRMVINLIDHDKGVYTVMYSSGAIPLGREPGVELPLEGSFTAKVSNLKSSVIVDSDDVRRQGGDLYSTNTPILASGIKTSMGFPLTSRGEVIGVMILNSFTSDAYTQHHRDLGEVLARNIVGVIVNAQMHSQIQREAHERTILAEIGRIIDSSIDIDQVYAPFIEQVNGLIPSDRIVISLLSHNGEVGTNAHVWGDAIPGYGIGDSFSTAGMAFEEAVRARKAIVATSDYEDTSVARYPGLLHAVDAGLKATIVAPLYSEDQIIGVLTLHSRSIDAYTDDDVALTERIAAQIAGAVANAELRLESEQNADLRERLATIGRIISSSLDIDEVYDSFIEQVNALIPSDRIAVLILDEQQHNATTAYAWGTELSEFRPGDTQQVHGTSIQEVISTRKGLLRLEEPLEPVKNPTPSQASGIAQGLRSLVVVPLISGDKVIGALILRSKTPSAYGRRDLELAELIAAQIAGAIANAQLHLQIQREAVERAALAEIGRIIDSSIDIQDVYQQFTEVVNRLIPSDRIAVALLNTQKHAVINAYVWGTEIQGFGLGGATPIIGTAVDDVLKTRTGVIAGAESPQEFIDRFPGQAASIAAGLRSMIVVPMAAGDKIIGTFLLRSKKPNAYKSRDMELAERIAAQISGAVANAQLHADVQKQALERLVLNEIGRIISSTLDVEEVYQTFAHRVRTLLPFDSLIINVFDPESAGLRRAYSVGAPDPPDPFALLIPSEGMFVHEIVTRKQPILFCPDHRHAVEKMYPSMTPMYDRGLRSYIGVPLISNDQVVGTLHLNSKESEAYTDNELYLAARIGLQIAGAIANSLMFTAQQKAERMLEQINEDLESNVRARARELSEANGNLKSSQDQLRALAARMDMVREEERTHISHEIHDELGQALTGLKFDISWIGRRMEEVKDAKLRDTVSKRISSIFTDIDENIELVRNLSARLRPAALDNFGLSAAIESEVQEFQERTGILCEINLPNTEIDIGEDAALGVFRILQEAMTNAARHAIPTKIIVNLEHDYQQIVLRVEDDGVGMEGIADTSSLGLLGMKERARLMGGDLVIRSAPNRGTTVSLCAPIHNQTMQHK